LRTLCGPTVMQAALAEFLRRGGRQRYLERVLPVFRERRQVLLQCLTEHMPAGTEWIEPAGGLCLWLTLPEGTSTDAVYRTALAEGVSVAPADRFMARATARGHLRLSLGSLPAERIPTAIEKLAGAIRQVAAASRDRQLEEVVALV